MMNPAASAAEQKFLEFDWTDEKWQNYLKNLYPIPNMTKMIKYKRKWFRNNIDSNLNDKDEGIPQSGVEEKNFKPTYGSSHSRTSSLLKYIQFHFASFVFQIFAIFLSVLYLLSTISSSIPAVVYNYSIISYFIGYCCEILNKYGRPKFSRIFYQNVMMNPSGEALIFMIFTLAIYKNLLMICPLLVTSVTNISSEFVSYDSIFPRFIRNNSVLWNIAFRINSNRRLWMKVRSDIEVYIGVLLIFLLFSGGSTILCVFLYWNFLKLRYRTNQFTALTFQEIDRYITSVLYSPYSPRVIASIYEKAKNVLRGIMNINQTQAYYSNSSPANRSGGSFGDYMNRYCAIQ